MSPSLNSGMVTMAINWNGDAAFQGLLNISWQSLVFSGILVGILFAWKKKKVGIGTFIVLAFFANFFWNHWLFAFMEGAQKNQFTFQGDAAFQSMLNLSTVPTFLVFVGVTMLLKAVIKKIEWGLVVQLIMAFALSIVWIHWVVPAWNSANMGSVSVPFIS